MFPCMIHSGQPFWSIYPICTCNGIRTGTCYSIGEVIQRERVDKIYKMLQENSIKMNDIYERFI